MKKGDVIGLYMKDGYLCAGKKPRSATATVYADAKKNNDVGIFDVVGIIDHHEGVINVCIVPGSSAGVLSKSGGTNSKRSLPWPDSSRLSGLNRRSH